MTLPENNTASKKRGPSVGDFREAQVQRIIGSAYSVILSAVGLVVALFSAYLIYQLFAGQTGAQSLGFGMLTAMVAALLLVNALTLIGIGALLSSVNNIQTNTHISAFLLQRQEAMNLAYHLDDDDSQEGK
ncbi:MAG: hypothetical protein JSS75_06025 [Bacteroidetes bacterium]|nr:hypothetical protein [Bacteroidota bacterium]